MVEWIVGHPVQCCCHPPREAFGLPYPGQRTVGIMCKAGVRFIRIMFDQGPPQILYIARRKVEAFGPDRWHDMSGVAGEKQLAEAQRLSDEATQRSNALLDRRAGDEIGLGLLVEAGPDFIPEALVWPGIDVIVKAALDVVAAARMRAHRAQRKAARMPHIDQLFGNGRRV